MNDLKKCDGSGLVVAVGAQCPACGATFWMGAMSEAAKTIPRHAHRATPSARYYPRIDHLRDEPLLNAAAQMRLTEEQAIDMLAVEVRRLRERLMRELELNGVPMTIVAPARGGK